MTVSAALLVLDPPVDRLAALVEYLRPVVSQYVVVVDDRTAVETAETMAKWPDVTLVPFRWVDDFSAGRNAALPHVTGDWILHVDPDELPSHAMLDFIRSVDAVQQQDVIWQDALYPAPLGYLFFTRNWYGGRRGEEWEEHWHCRLFRNHPASRWYKPLHEQVMLHGRAESDTRGTPFLPKAPLGAYLIHSKPAERIGVDDAVYNRIEAADLTKRETAYTIAGEQ
jgi:glycosyltransferase involved in cell wall biosynthesis